jgi:hypothetical protein
MKSLDRTIHSTQVRGKLALDMYEVLEYKFTSFVM